MNVLAHRLSIRDNFALIAIASTAASLRRRLGTRVVGLFGHESDDGGILHARGPAHARRSPARAGRVAGPSRPSRSSRDRPGPAAILGAEGTLLEDLASVRIPGGHDLVLPGRARRRWGLASLLCHWENRREWFRDELMRRTQRLRAQVLEAAQAAVASGHIDRPEDVFFLTRDNLEAHPDTWRGHVARGRAGWKAARAFELPWTASRDELEDAMLVPAPWPTDPGSGPFPGHRSWARRW